MDSWVPVPDGSDFPLANLPYGVFARAREPARVGIAIGDHVLDLSRLDIPYVADFAHPTLNPFLARGRPAWDAVRAAITDLLTDWRHEPAARGHLHPRSSVRMRLPFDVADYVDFYASEHHATNVGRMFRPEGDPLTPNWRYMPIGYHGRAGTVVVSGTEVRRPCGQYRPDPHAPPEFGPSRRLDIEAEVGFVVGVPAPDGSVSTGDFEEHVFGAALVNDWSARDLQAWEYVPLGPFLGKSFATSISPWVIPLAALQPARVPPPPQHPPPLPYLREDQPWGLDLTLTVSWNGTVVARPPFGQMYWTPAQQLAHLTVNGASLRTGDLFASGTVSGPEPDQRGSFLELAWNGERPVTLADGSLRTFLIDGDEVVITARSNGSGVPIGFGEVRGRVLPARS